MAREVMRQMPWIMVVALAMMAASAEAVEVCKVTDLSLVTQTGEFFLAGKFFPIHVFRLPQCLMTGRPLTVLPLAGSDLLGNGHDVHHLHFDGIQVNQ